MQSYLSRAGDLVGTDVYQAPRCQLASFRRSSTTHNFITIQLFKLEKWWHGYVIQDVAFGELPQQTIVVLEPCWISSVFTLFATTSWRTWSPFNTVGKRSVQQLCWMIWKEQKAETSWAKGTTFPLGIQFVHSTGLLLQTSSSFYNLFQLSPVFSSNILDNFTDPTNCCITQTYILHYEHRRASSYRLGASWKRQETT